MIKIFRQPAEGAFEETTGVGVLNDLPGDGDYLWVDLDDPTEEEAAVLSNVFNFHPLAIEDCWHDPQSPKVDDYNDYVFIVVHGIRYDEKNRDFSSHELSIFLGPNYLVTFQRLPSTPGALMAIRVSMRALFPVGRSAASAFGILPLLPEPP